MNSQLSSLGSLPASRRGCKYAKIPLVTKMRLFKGVMEEGIPIKRISHKLNIKYSTAKTLVRQFKDQQMQIDFNILENETSILPTAKVHQLRAHYTHLASSPPQNLAKFDEHSEMNITAIISPKESPDCHGLSAVRSQGRVEVVSRILSKL